MNRLRIEYDEEFGVLLHLESNTDGERMQDGESPTFTDDVDVIVGRWYGAFNAREVYNLL